MDVQQREYAEVARSSSSAPGPNIGNGARKRNPLNWIALAAALLLFGAVAVFGLQHLRGESADDSSSHAKQSRSAAWRVQLLMRMATGGIPELSFMEAWKMIRTPGGFGLAGAITGGASVEGSIHSPTADTSDIRIGGEVYRNRCSMCHGTEGAGGHGPALNKSGLRHGDSDFALYRTIRDGIPGTAMAPAGLTFDERWRVVAYLRMIQMRVRSADASDKPRLNVRVTRDDLIKAGTRADQWLTYSGSPNGWRHSTLAQVTPENVGRLRLLWSRQFDTLAPKFESTPIMAADVMYVTLPPATVVALNARTGAQYWSYERKLPAELSLCCGRVNRGVAILEDSVFFGSLDGHLTALDANTGRVRWDIEVASSEKGYSLTGAPLIVEGQVVVGVAGGEFPTRGFIAAYDPNTGRQIWKFETIPGPGVPGHSTWESDAWKTGGGSTWNTGVYDRELGLIYWGVGNPAPEFSGDPRPGDNLYTNSVVALHATTGQLAWHFQFTPHDEHDWDSTQTPVLADLPIGGKSRKVVCWPNRNGFYYVLDRTSGEFLVGVPFVEQNWAHGLDERGRPLPREDQKVSVTGRLIKPGLAGGTNWQNPAFDPQRSLVYVVSTESASVFTKSVSPQRGERGIYLGSSGSIMLPVARFVRALDAASGARRWEYTLPTSEDDHLSYSGLLSTAGGLVFGAARGTAFALDSSTGKELWHLLGVIPTLRRSRTRSTVDRSSRSLPGNRCSCSASEYHSFVAVRFSNSGTLPPGGT
jgi:alcohol dehydrogenase (cytochrome c)